ncbi:MAG: hypothetical protein E7233_02400 [Lachnospiraceae bacterium]|nr:hypothetical protein [Lachnospiraceae bacterium]
MFVDSDDWVHEDFCRKAYETVTDTGARMAIFDLCYTAGDSKEGYIHASLTEVGIYPSSDILRLRLTGDIAVYAWNKIYHRSLWNNIRFPVGDILEDDAVIHELIDNAGSITSRANADKSFDKWIYVQRKKRYEYIKEHHLEMLGIEKNNLAFSVLKYAEVLSRTPNGRHKMNELKNMLKNEKIMLEGASLKREMAFKLWYYFPGVFTAVIKAFRH